MRLLHLAGALLFPPKCVLCSRLLQREETDLCGTCRRETELFHAAKEHNSLVARSAILWYYKDKVRESLLRYKFGGMEHYAATYARFLAMQVQEKGWDCDVVTWVPASRARRFRRGFDHVRLIAEPVARELGLPAVPLLKKARRNRVQSTISGVAARRANVLNVYLAINRERIAGKRILLIDDIITTGATMNECANVLRFAGAADVRFAAVAGSGSHTEKQQ